eukprot:jgi/Tetstr1/456355/TSEL_043091.t2
MADEATPGGGDGPGPIEIKVKTLNQDVYELAVSPEMYVSALKIELEMRSGMPIDRQRLIYRGRVLGNESTLAATGIENGHSIHLVERPADAPPPSSQPPSEARPAAQPQHRVAMGAINVPLDGSAPANALPDAMNQMLAQMLTSMGVAVPSPQSNPSSPMQQGAQASPGAGGAAPAPSATGGAANPDGETQPGPPPAGFPDLGQVLSSLLTSMNQPPGGAQHAGIQRPGPQPGSGSIPGVQPDGRPQAGATHQGPVPRPPHLLLALNQFITNLETAASRAPPQGDAASGARQPWPHPAIQTHPAMQRFSVGMDSMPQHFSDILRSVLSNVDLPQPLRDALSGLPQRQAGEAATAGTPPQPAPTQGPLPPPRQTGAPTQAGGGAAGAGATPGARPQNLQPPPDGSVAVVCAAVAQLLRRCAAFLEQYGLPQMQRAAEQLLASMSREGVQSIRLQDLSAALASMGCLLMELGRLATFLNDYSQGIVAPLVNGPPQFVQQAFAAPGAQRAGPHMRVSVQQRTAPGARRPPAQQAAGAPAAATAQGPDAAPGLRPTAQAGPPGVTQAPGTANAHQAGTGMPAAEPPQSQAGHSSSRGRSPPVPTPVTPVSAWSPARGADPQARSEPLASHPLPSSAFPGSGASGRRAQGPGTARPPASVGGGRGLGPGLPARAGLGASGLPAPGRGARPAVAPPAADAPSGPATSMAASGASPGGGDIGSALMSMLNGPGGEGIIQMASQLAQSPAMQRMAEQMMGPQDEDPDQYADQQADGPPPPVDFGQLLNSMLPMVQSMVSQGSGTAQDPSAATNPAQEGSGGLSGGVEATSARGGAPPAPDFGQLLNSMMPMVQSMVSQGSTPAQEPSAAANPAQEGSGGEHNGVEAIPRGGAPPAPDFGQLMTSMMPMVQNMLGQLAGPPGAAGNQSRGGPLGAPPASVPPHPSSPAAQPANRVVPGSWQEALSTDELQLWEATISNDMASISASEPHAPAEGSLSEAYLSGITDPRNAGGAA